MDKLDKQKVKKKLISKILEGYQLTDILNKGNELNLNKRKFYEWLNSDETFRSEYILARKTQALFAAEQIMDEIKKVEDLPAEQLNRFVIEVLKEKVSAMKFIASKILPKVYGTDVQINNNVLNINPIQNMIVFDSQAPQQMIDKICDAPPLMDN